MPGGSTRSNPASRSRTHPATPDGSPPPCCYIADLYLESKEEFEALRASPEGQAAVADVPNYATGGVQFLYTEVTDVI